MINAASPNVKVTPIRANLSAMDKPKPRSKRLLTVALAISAATAIIWAGYHYLYVPAQTYALPAGSFTTSLVKSSSFQEFIAVRGKVMPADTISVAPQVSGRVEEVLVTSGNIVQAGDPLVRLSNAALEIEALMRQIQTSDQVNGQHSAQMTINSRLAQDAREILENEHIISQLNQKIARVEPLVKSGSATKSALTDLTSERDYRQKLLVLLNQQWANNKAITEDLTSSLQITSALLNDLSLRQKTQLQTLVIKAPRSGQITGLDLTVGQELPAGRAIANIDNRKFSKAVFLTDEFYLTRVAIGQTISAESGSSKYTLRITDVSPRVENGQFKIEAEFTDIVPENLLHGQAITGKILINPADEQTLTLPNSAFMEISGGQWVFVVDEAGRAKKVDVKLGRKTNEAIEVLSGLAEGDRVITSGYRDFAHHDSVTVNLENENDH